ncbi:hypothetical protein P879_07946 [Paragonimus westermani]|uniref:Radical SAM core domain-containing protein n=1 Tax=Paragonimus westermani TaxID=34504 RepID=A0A8T0DRF0_9TREM|nr:hypothetical protein P879_07946 [Paragonimus westermani]
MSVFFPTVEEKLLRFTKLTDRFNRVHDYLRISLTERCNLHCSYCRPPTLTSSCTKQCNVSTNELLFLANYFVQRGVTKIRLTGGEPLMCRDLPEIITSLDHLRTTDKKLKQICMTSNGVGFTRKACLLRKCGLDSVTISLDSLNPARVKQLTGYPVFKQAFGAICAALENGFDPVKVNCVVIREFNDDEICDFAQLTKNLPIEVRFIEYMPFGGNKWDYKKLVSYGEMMDKLRTKFSLIGRIATESSSTAKMYRIEDWPGKVGFITSMTDNFCSGCTRLRLTADGHLKPCLHNTDEVDLISTLRKANLNPKNLQSPSLLQSVEHEQESSSLCSVVKQLNTLVDAAVNRKAKQHSDMHELARVGNRPMVRIGG